MCAVFYCDVVFCFGGLTCYCSTFYFYFFYLLLDNLFFIMEEKEYLSHHRYKG